MPELKILSIQIVFLLKVMQHHLNLLTLNIFMSDLKVLF